MCDVGPYCMRGDIYYCNSLFVRQTLCHMSPVKTADNNANTNTNDDATELNHRAKYGYVIKLFFTA